MMGTLQFLLFFPSVHFTAEMPIWTFHFSHNAVSNDKILHGNHTGRDADNNTGAITPEETRRSKEFRNIPRYIKIKTRTRSVSGSEIASNPRFTRKSNTMQIPFRGVWIWIQILIYLELPKTLLLLSSRPRKHLHSSRVRHWGEYGSVLFPLSGRYDSSSSYLPRLTIHVAVTN